MDKRPPPDQPGEDTFGNFAAPRRNIEAGSLLLED